jgi:hypothetical protein
VATLRQAQTQQQVSYGAQLWDLTGPWCGCQLAQPAVIDADRFCLLLALITT